MYERGNTPLTHSTHTTRTQVKILRRRGEVDTADPATLSSFINDTLRFRPGRKAALILIDHGAAYHGFGRDEHPTATNSSIRNNPNVQPSRTWMSMPQLTAGLAEGLAAAGRQRLDVVVFDACIMSSYSVVQSLAPLSRFVAAAETNEYGGYQYQALLTQLSANPTMTPFELGHAFVHLFDRVSGRPQKPTARERLRCSAVVVRWLWLPLSACLCGWGVVRVRVRGHHNHNIQHTTALARGGVPCGAAGDVHTGGLGCDDGGPHTGHGGAHQCTQSYAGGACGGPLQRASARRPRPQALRRSGGGSRQHQVSGRCWCLWTVLIIRLVSKRR